MAIYFHDSEKLPVGIPVYGFAYRIDDETLEVIARCKPTLGVIEESAKCSCGGKFIPEDKTKRWCDHRLLTYATTYDEAVRSYKQMVEDRIRRLDAKIGELKNMLSEAIADSVMAGRVDDG